MIVCVMLHTVCHALQGLLRSAGGEMVGSLGRPVDSEALSPPRKHQRAARSSAVERGTTAAAVAVDSSHSQQRHSGKDNNQQQQQQQQRNSGSRASTPSSADRPQHVSALLQCITVYMLAV